MKMGYSISRTLGLLLDNLNKRDRGLYASFIGYTLSAGVYPLFAVALPKLVIGELTGAGRPEAVLIIVLGFFLASAAFGFIKTFLQNIAYSHLTFLRVEYVRDAYAKMMDMDYKYCEDAGFMDEHAKGLEAVSNNDNGVEGVYHAMFEAPAFALTALIYIVFIGAQSPAVLAALLINIAAVYIIGRRTHLCRYSLKTGLDHVSRRINYYSRTTADFTYGKDIRLYDLAERIKSNFKREIVGYCDILTLVAKKEFVWGFLGLGTLIASDAATYGILAAKCAEGMPIADFSMYIAAAASLSLMLKSFVELANKVVNESEYVNDYFEFIAEDLGDGGGEREADDEPTLEIEFKNVSFKYPGTDNYILKNFDFTVKRGERLAIVGVNGAGKTTIVKLMTGLFAPTEGDILINGTPIGDFSKKALYSMFSAVFQDVNVMAFTVLENIGGMDADRARAEDTLRRVGLWEKIKALPKGLDTVMLKIIDEEGAVLSGGESQKLAIARALYKDAKMVIMDEPTAALDALAEAAIYEDFASLVAGKTAVYISHRLASTKFCDRIALFDRTGLRESGTHEELMRLGGEYCRMFTVQGKYYNTGAEEGEA